MTVKFTFQDYYSIEAPSKEQFKEFKDFFANGGKSLIIDMEATHAGIPLNNPRFYIPARMRKGTSTIEVGETPMKILKHHDLHSDPVGKTLYREYVDTIPEDLVGNPDVITLTSDTASMKEQLRAMRSLKRAGVIDREGYRGLGYIRIQAEISDERAVKQLEDGLFDAISTNFDSPNEVYCSVCGTNIAKEGFCEHEMGEMYFADGMEEEGDMQFVCQYIPGEHFYKEASFINLKGDQLASVKIVDTKNKDNNQTVFMSKDSVESGHSTFQFKDSVEEDTMKIKGKEVSLSDAEQKVFDSIKKLYADISDEDAYQLMKDSIELASSEKYLADAKEAGVDEDQALLFAIHACRKDGKLDAKEICDGIVKELESMKEEGLLTDEELTAALAKVSEDGLVKLPESAFCGPEKTFPVPDSAHATAAKRFVDKYEGPVNKVDLLAKISLKAKAFGEESKENKNNNGDVEIAPMSAEAISKLANDELHNLYHVAEKELISRKEVLKRECSDCAVHVAETEAAKKELGEARDALDKSETVVQVLRGELKRAYHDYEVQVDEHIQLGAKLNTAKVEKLALVGVLTQKYDTLENATAALKDADVSKEEKSMMDSLDVEKAAIKLNDGMTRTPEGTAGNPAIDTDGDNKQIPDGLSAPALEALENIKDCLDSNQVGQARQIYGTMKSLGLFGDDITFESLSADSKTPAE